MKKIYKEVETCEDCLYLEMRMEEDFEFRPFCRKIKDCTWIYDNFDPDNEIHRNCPLEDVEE